MYETIYSEKLSPAFRLAKLCSEGLTEVKNETGTKPHFILHCGSKNRIPVTSSNSCTEYDPISIIFGLENHQRVFSLQVSNWRVLMKLSASFVFLHGYNHLQQTTLKWVCVNCEEDRILIKKVCMSSNVMERKD